MPGAGCTRNPLRILDSKNPAMQAMIAGAPRLIDYLGDASRAHFEGLQALLRAARDRVQRSIRGWCAASTTTTCTVFEWITDRARRPGHDLRRRPL